MQYLNAPYEPGPAVLGVVFSLAAPGTVLRCKAARVQTHSDESSQAHWYPGSAVGVYSVGGSGLRSGVIF